MDLYVRIIERSKSWLIVKLRLSRILHTVVATIAQPNELHQTRWFWLYGSIVCGAMRCVCVLVIWMFSFFQHLLVSMVLLFNHASYTHLLNSRWLFNYSFFCCSREHNFVTVFLLLSLSLPLSPHSHTLNS